MKFKEIFEKADSTVIYVKDELWVTYGQGSGQTAQLPDLKRYLNSDNSDTEHYDSLVSRIQDKGINNKAIKSKDNVTMYEVPEYKWESSQEIGIKKYDIFGGDIKPKRNIYMIITKEKSTIINFFEKKSEALNWMRGL